MLRSQHDRDMPQDHGSWTSAEIHWIWRNVNHHKLRHATFVELQQLLWLPVKNCFQNGCGRQRIVLKLNGCILQRVFWNILNVESAKLLLAAKASVDIKNDDGWEPQPMSQPLDEGRLRNCLGLRNSSCETIRSYCATIWLYCATRIAQLICRN